MPIKRYKPEQIEAQRAVIAHLNGPLLVAAGPGSGKTYSQLNTLNGRPILRP